MRPRPQRKLKVHELKKRALFAGAFDRKNKKTANVAASLEPAAAAALTAKGACSAVAACSKLATSLPEWKAGRVGRPQRSRQGLGPTESRHRCAQTPTGVAPE